MSNVLMFLNDQLSVCVRSESQGVFVDFCDCVYTRVSPVESRIPFYDWVLDSDNRPVAFELHYSPDEIIHSYNITFPQRDYIELSPYPRIWLGKSRCGSEAGFEAWGGMDLYTNGSGGVMISVATINELDDHQVQQLLY